VSTLKVNNVTDLGADAVVTDGVIAADAITSLNASALPTGSILQVVSTFKDSVFSTSSTSFVDVTGMSATMTPSSTSSKILVGINTYIGSTASSDFRLKIQRNDSDVFEHGGDDYSYGTNIGYSATNRLVPFALVFNVLDSPASSSAQTYKIKIKSTSGTSYINRSGDVAGNTAVSSIVLMEVAG